VLAVRSLSDKEKIGMNRIRLVSTSDASGILAIYEPIVRETP
jgi:hypothetical protein